MSNSGITQYDNRNYAIVHAIRPEGGLAPSCGEPTFRTISNRVTPVTLAFDQRGRLWGAGEGGVICWTITSNRVMYETYHIEHGLAGHDIRCLLIDSQNRIYVGHRSGWVSVFDSNHGCWDVLPHRAPDIIQQLIIRDDKLIAFSGDQLFLPQTGLTYPLPFVALTAVAWKDIYIGANNGLWTLDDNLQPESIWSGEAILHMVPALDVLWFGTTAGVWTYDPNDGELDISSDLTVVQLAADNHESDLFALTDEPRLHRISDKDVLLLDWHSGWQHIDQLAVSRDWIAFGTKDEMFVRQVDRMELPHRLTPDADTTLPIAVNVVVGDAEMLLQSPNSLHHLTENDTWEQIKQSSSSEHEVLGVCLFNNKLVMIKRGFYGVGTIENGLFLPQKHTPFHHVMAFWKDPIREVMHVIAVEHTAHRGRLRHFFATDDLSSWQSGMSIPPDVGAVIALGPGKDKAVVLLTTTAIYSLESWERIQTFDYVVSAATIYNDKYWIMTDGQVIINTRTSEEIPLRPDFRETVLAIELLNNVLLVGTSDGLWVKKSSGWSKCDLPEGLSSNMSILSLIGQGENVYVCTANGVFRCPIDRL